MLNSQVVHNSIVFNKATSVAGTSHFPQYGNQNLIMLAQWQYWWWFWFTSMICLYFVFIVRILFSHHYTFNPRMTTTYRSRGRWGDLLICVIPIFWCLNILTNSHFLLRHLEWQTENSLFTLRVRGKQWYWVYKYDLRAHHDINTPHVIIGRNKKVKLTTTNFEAFKEYTRHPLLPHFKADRLTDPFDKVNKSELRAYLPNLNNTKILNKLYSTRLKSTLLKFRQKSFTESNADYSHRVAVHDRFHKKNIENAWGYWTETARRRHHPLYLIPLWKGSNILQYGYYNRLAIIDNFRRYATWSDLHNTTSHSINCYNAAKVKTLNSIKAAVLGKSIDLLNSYRTLLNTMDLVRAPVLKSLVVLTAVNNFQYINGVKILGPGNHLNMRSLYEDLLNLGVSKVEASPVRYISSHFDSVKMDVKLARALKALILGIIKINLDSHKWYIGETTASWYVKNAITEAYIGMLNPKWGGVGCQKMNTHLQDTLRFANGYNPFCIQMRTNTKPTVAVVKFLNTVVPGGVLIKRLLSSGLHHHQFAQTLHMSVSGAVINSAHMSINLSMGAGTGVSGSAKRILLLLKKIITHHVLMDLKATAMRRREVIQGVVSRAIANPLYKTPTLTILRIQKVLRYKRYEPFIPDQFKLPYRMWGVYPGLVSRWHLYEFSEPNHLAQQTRLLLTAFNLKGIKLPGTEVMCDSGCLIRQRDDFSLYVGKALREWVCKVAAGPCTKSRAYRTSVKAGFNNVNNRLNIKHTLLKAKAHRFVTKSVRTSLCQYEKVDFASHKSIFAAAHGVQGLKYVGGASARDHMVFNFIWSSATVARHAGINTLVTDLVKRAVLNPTTFRVYKEHKHFTLEDLRQMVRGGKPISGLFAHWFNARTKSAVEVLPHHMQFRARGSVQPRDVFKLVEVKLLARYSSDLYSRRSVLAAVGSKSKVPFVEQWSRSRTPLVALGMLRDQIISRNPGVLQMRNIVYSMFSRVHVRAIEQKIHWEMFKKRCRRNIKIQSITVIYGCVGILPKLTPLQLRNNYISTLSTGLLDSVWLRARTGRFVTQQTVYTYRKHMAQANLFARQVAALNLRLRAVSRVTRLFAQKAVCISKPHSYDPTVVQGKFFYRMCNISAEAYLRTQWNHISRIKNSSLRRSNYLNLASTYVHRAVSDSLKSTVLKNCIVKLAVLAPAHSPKSLKVCIKARLIEYACIRYSSALVTEAVTPVFGRLYLRRSLGDFISECREFCNTERIYLDLARFFPNLDYSNVSVELVKARAKALAAARLASFQAAVTRHVRVINSIFDPVIDGSEDDPSDGNYLDIYKKSSKMLVKALLKAFSQNSKREFTEFLNAQNWQSTMSTPLIDGSLESVTHRVYRREELGYSLKKTVTRLAHLSLAQRNSGKYLFPKKLADLRVGIMKQATDMVSEHPYKDHVFGQILFNSIRGINAFSLKKREQAEVTEWAKDLAWKSLWTRSTLSDPSRIVNLQIAIKWLMRREARSWDAYNATGRRLLHRPRTALGVGYWSAEGLLSARSGIKPSQLWSGSFNDVSENVESRLLQPRSLHRWIKNTVRSPQYVRLTPVNRSNGLLRNVFLKFQTSAVTDAIRDLNPNVHMTIIQKKNEPTIFTSKLLSATKQPAIEYLEKVKGIVSAGIGSRINQLISQRQAYINNLTLSKKQSYRRELVNNKRLLWVTRQIVLPIKTPITIITNSYDVIHSWFIPGLGLKMDCVPGRSTHHTIYVDRPGYYYGQCAEVCGRRHHHMPIKVLAVPFAHFLFWWNKKVNSRHWGTKNI